MNNKVTLTADLVEGFAGAFLSARYDDAKPTPEFHRKCWRLYTSPKKQVGIVAPRGHAKSTALTYDYIMAEVCFRTASYVILIGSTEDKSAEQLSNISEELHTNEDLRVEFGIAGFESDTKTEIIVVCDDGHRFRIVARGAEQKIRGAMWNGKRPDLIVCDDMEDDEQVENKDRRSKFRRWFFRAAKQALSKAGRIRVHGTILHDDSLLARLIKNKAWTFLFFKAHRSYDDFSDLLWPEQWNAEELRKIQIEFEEDGDSGGYSQEYLNTPLDNADAFLKKDWFLPMREEDYESQKKMYAGADFAVSKADMSNRTSFTAGGKDVLNQISIVGQVKGRWDTAEWIDELFDFNERWQPELFFVEGGVIWLSVYPMIVKEMQERDIYINFEVRQPIKDKATRGRPLQKRMKVGNVRFDKQAEWYPDFEQELLKFTGGSQALLDDQFDSAAILLAGMESVPNLEEEDFEEEDEIEVNYFNRHMNRGSEHRTSTGY